MDHHAEADGFAEVLDWHVEAAGDDRQVLEGCATEASEAVDEGG